MTHAPTTPRRLPTWASTAGILSIFAIGVAVLMLWLVGTFKPKVTTHTRAPHERALGQASTLTVERRTSPSIEVVTGTVEAVHRVDLASRLLARAVDVRAIAGQRVAKGDVLVRLDASDLLARRAQAEAAVAEAQAHVDQAGLEESRLRSAFDKNAVSSIEMDRAKNARIAAEASLARVSQSLNEATSVLDFATITSPIDGIIVDKRVNTGDTISPGTVVVTLLDPTRMQLVASVRESLARSLGVGTKVGLSIDAASLQCEGTISEIVPEADTASRSFTIKVTGSFPTSVLPGMFGRVSLTTADESILTVPLRAVRTIGQVHSVDVVINGARRQRSVRLGRTLTDQVEIISGLSPGEQIVLDAAEGR